MKFEIFKNKRNNKFYFNLKSRNGQVVLTSEGCPTKTVVKKNITTVQKNCTNEKWIETKVEKNGTYTFAITNTKKTVAGISQKYNSVTTMKKGMKAVVRACATETVVDLTAASN
ncbi:MAG: hypothetical protein ACI8P3_004388 [Saprospiraceae bacterium]|jgi:uncharacterized protein YegP (UPF0339 family)